ncbi:MAG TPA: phosphoribosylanthranilate isomerase [Gammaproteobacteria bacterium]|nr:phosphoribosylanthranilate isomerase [Gammaproteobacteria bacterium]
MARTRVKICGITRPEDACCAAGAGVDAIGLVFYEPSPRNVSPAQAGRIAAVLPPFVTTVGLFVDPEPGWVEQVLSRVPLDLLQFHGDEPATFCSGFGRPYIKALRMRAHLDVAAAAARYGTARGLLLDSYRPGMAGGTGQTFDWARVPTACPLPIILAGGLDAGNVAVAIRRVRPYGVDVSGGVEAAKGVKSAGKIAAFVREVQGADSN